MDEGVVWVAPTFPRAPPFNKRTSTAGESASGRSNFPTSVSSPLRRDATIRAPTRFPQAGWSHDRAEAAPNLDAVCDQTAVACGSRKEAARRIPDDSVSTSPSRSSTASPRTPTARPPTWPSSSRAPIRTSCSTWGVAQSTYCARSAADRRQHRARGAAAAARHPARPGPVRAVQRARRRRHQRDHTALGGDPIGILYEGEKRFDIVTKVDRQIVNSPQAIARCPSIRPTTSPSRWGRCQD